MGQAGQERDPQWSDRAGPVGAVERAQFALRLLNGKWVVPVLDALARQPRRHGELRRALGPKLSEKVLTETLRRMEAAQLIRRSVTHKIPPSVLYTLTDTGRSLLDPVQRMSDWTASHWQDLARLPGMSVDD